LLEKIFGFLQIYHVTPLGFSQQFQAQLSLPEKVCQITDKFPVRFTQEWGVHTTRTETCAEQASRNKKAATPGRGLTRAKEI